MNNLEQKVEVNVDEIVEENGKLPEVTEKIVYEEPEFAQPCENQMSFEKEEEMIYNQIDDILSAEAEMTPK